MTYSCALFDHSEMSLADAQQNKYATIFNRLENNKDILEIGCGWGGFADYASRQGADVTGITIFASAIGLLQIKISIAKYKS